MLRIILGLFLLTVYTAHSQISTSNTEAYASHLARSKSVVILELFTSEGCSSCPPADQLAVTLQEIYKERLMVLEFHVDYWDRLGWKDPFSKAAYSERQRNYGEKFRLNSIYTPQAIINGIHETVGSNENKLRSFINNNLAVTEKGDLFIEQLKDNEKNTISLKWDYKNGETSSVVHFALVQKQATINVKAGENDGRRLSHHNIVRDFVTIDSKHNTTVKLHIPADLQTNEIKVMAYVQEKETGKIVATALIL
ncbi:MAG: DUF1223 domain-containing protein [Chitinophagaceae bacterium]|nr:DUF1223 domain-containing protein [Chitinophagaceae bacterium]